MGSPQSKMPKAVNLGRLMKPAHKCVSRMLGYVLTSGGFEAWAGFVTVAKARMTLDERVALAWAALRALDTPEQAETVAAGVLRHAGYPLPPFLGAMDEARFWASLASRAELKAFALASFDAMSAQDQAAFFQHISETEVAA